MQKAMFPIFKTWESQGMNEGSHIETKAIDLGVLVPYYDYELHAPFDGKVVFVDIPKNGNGVAFQSSKKVLFADGTKDYMTIWSGHADNPPKLNSIFKQGAVYSHMGTTCNVAKHCHLEVIKGKFVKPTKFTSLGFYKFDNAIEPFKALFVDDNTLIKYSRYEWINVNKENQEIIENVNYVTLYDMNIRTGAGLQYSRKLTKDLTEDGQKNSTSSNPFSFGVYKKGTIFTAYTFIYKQNGDIWAKTPSGYICIKDSNTTYCKKY